MDWDSLKKKLPCKNNEEHLKILTKMFKRFDVNNNGHLSLAEIDLGFKSLGKSMEIIYNAKVPMIRAFNSAKSFNSNNEKTDLYPEYI